MKMIRTCTKHAVPVELAIDIKITITVPLGALVGILVYLSASSNHDAQVLRGQQEYYVYYGMIPSRSSIQGPNDSSHTNTTLTSTFPAHGLAHRHPRRILGGASQAHSAIERFHLATFG